MERVLIMDLEKHRGAPEAWKNGDPHLHSYNSYFDRSLEKRQLDASIHANEETVDYLYSSFTAESATHQKGIRPLLEKIVDTVCADSSDNVSKAKALVRWRRANIQHVAKAGLGTEEEILLGGYSMCHDASRTLIILAQIAGIGSRMIIGSHHTYTELFVNSGWAVFDPSPTIPFAFYETGEGRLLSTWDIKQDPDLVDQCASEFVPTPLLPIERIKSFFSDFFVTNYTLAESNAFMAQRFLRLITAHKILDNYDYRGHVAKNPVSSFVDLDDILNKWFESTME